MKTIINANRPVISAKAKEMTKICKYLTTYWRFLAIKIKINHK